MRSGFRPFSTHKRYIGALARMGMLRPESVDNMWSGRRTEKRHIGALARSGWMPSAFRPVHGGRFSRSGRARSHIVGSWNALLLLVQCFTFTLLEKTFLYFTLSHHYYHHNRDTLITKSSTFFRVFFFHTSILCNAHRILTCPVRLPSGAVRRRFYTQTPHKKAFGLTHERT